MKTVELSAALGQAQVVENLKNFVGVDAQGAAALMTPERLAAVAGELQRMVVGTDGKPFAFFKGAITTKLDNTEPINIAKSVMDYIPDLRCEAICFDIIHNEAGRRTVRGLLYGTRDYGFFEISNLNAGTIKVTLNAGSFCVS